MTSGANVPLQYFRDNRDSIMAFAGMFLGVVFIIIIITAFVIAFIELIIGIILMCKKKKVPAIILFVLSAIPGVVATGFIVFAVCSTLFPKYETYNGKEVMVSMRAVRNMKTLIKENDMDGLDELLDKHPELIYYQDNNHETLLEYGLHDRNVEIMEIALDHGAEFDAEPTFRYLRYDCSLDHFFDDEYWFFIPGYEPDQSKLTEGETTDEMIETARFAVDHGASTVWSRQIGRWTFADSVENWINRDSFISDKDREFLDYARLVS